MLVAATIYIPALVFSKIAMIFLYYRILAMEKWWKWTLRIIAFIIAGYGIALIISIIFGCSPIQKSWDAAITGGHCINRPAVYMAIAVTNTVSDVVLIIIPIPIVYRLKLPFSQKLGVACIFGVGCA